MAAAADDDGIHSDNEEEEEEEEERESENTTTTKSRPHQTKNTSLSRSSPRSPMESPPATVVGQSSGLRLAQNPSSKASSSFHLIDTPRLSFGINAILSSSSSETASSVSSCPTSVPPPPSARVTSSSFAFPFEFLVGIPFHGGGGGLYAAAAARRCLGFYAAAAAQGQHPLFGPEALPFLQSGLIKMAPHQMTMGHPASVPAPEGHVMSSDGGTATSGLVSTIFPWMQERKDRLSGESRCKTASTFYCLSKHL